MIKANDPDQLGKAELEKLIGGHAQAVEDLERHRLTFVRQKVHEEGLIDRLDNEHILRSLIGLDKVDAAINSV